MMNEIAVRLIGEVGWGLKLRVFAGAALSTLDIITDAFITYTFWKDGKNMFFRASLTMLCTSMLILLFMVWAQNRKTNRNKVLREMVPVILGLKPAFDAFRVASGAKIEEGQVLDPLLEMTLTKAIGELRKFIRTDIIVASV